MVRYIFAIAKTLTTNGLFGIIFLNKWHSDMYKASVCNLTIRGECATSWHVSNHERVPIFLFVLFSLFITPLQATTYGTWTGVLQQTTRALLPTGATNIMQGFTQLDAGFLLQDSATTCTFDVNFPVRGRVALYGGQLYLNRDLTLSFIDSPYGTILGNSFALEFDKQPTDIGLPALGETGVMNVRLTSAVTAGTAAPYISSVD
jgi:hypothetical protein